VSVALGGLPMSGGLGIGMALGLAPRPPSAARRQSAPPNPQPNPSRSEHRHEPLVVVRRTGSLLAAVGAGLAVVAAASWLM
jgi:hypothetical protein